MDDPFGSLAKHCHYSNSQEDLLGHTPFCRESDCSSGDESPESCGIPVESTGIFMCSVPESSKNDDINTPHDEFQTPPEESLLLSPSDNHAGQGVDGVGDNDETVAVDHGCTDAEGTVDLGQDSNLGFSEVKSTPRVHVMSEVTECGSEKFRVLKREFPAEEEGLGEAPPKKPKHSENNLCLESPENVQRNELMLVKINGVAGNFFEEMWAKKRRELSSVAAPVVSCNSGTEVLDSEFDEIGVVLKEGSPLEGAEVGVGIGMSNGENCEADELHSIGEGGSSSKNIEDLDKFKYVGSSGVNLKAMFKGLAGRRELPSSICGPAENAAADLAPGLFASQQSIMGLLDVLKMVAGEKHCSGPEKIDILETVKSRGMTFPRPRWLPEGKEWP